MFTWTNASIWGRFFCPAGLFEEPSYRNHGIFGRWRPFRCHFLGKKLSILHMKLQLTIFGSWNFALSLVLLHVSFASLFFLASNVELSSSVVASLLDHANVALVSVFWIGVVVSASNELGLTKALFVGFTSSGSFNVAEHAWSPDLLDRSAEISSDLFPSFFVELGIVVVVLVVGCWRVEHGVGIVLGIWFLKKVQFDALFSSPVSSFWDEIESIVSFWLPEQQQKRWELRKVSFLTIF